MEPVMKTKNRASAHNHRGGNVRKLKRLLPVLLIPVLLAGVALARPAGVINSGGGQSVAAPKPFRTGGDNLRLYFGTVVRDTADDQSADPGRCMVPLDGAPWTSFFPWGWVSFLIQR
jgi:hypothetical protein